MTVTYQFLAPPLHGIADQAMKFLKSEWGITQSKIKLEEPLGKDIRGRPTLQANTKDQHIICIEISDRPYPPQIDPMIVDCMNDGLPVKLYVGIPEGDDISQKDVKLFMTTGVGLMVIGSECKVLHSALSQSLTAVRKPEPKSFPTKYRQCVADAHDTFRHGDPAKASLRIHEEVEDLARRLADKATQKGWWKNLGSHSPPDAMKPTTSYKVVAKFLAEHLDSNAADMPDLNGYLLDRVVAAVGYRNDGAHKPKTLAALKKLHKESRTRFESAADLLRDLSNAAKRL